MNSIVTTSLPQVLRLILLSAVTGLLAACSTAPAVKKSDPIAKQKRLDQALALFSTNASGGQPAEWEPLVLIRKKKQTEYELVKDGDLTVVRAYADKASSGLRHVVDIDPLKHSWLSWRWKASGLIKTADNFHRETEDSPVRIILAFDGDKDKLSFTDMILSDTVKLISGHEMPYATLMYIWENKAPVGTVIANSRTARIQMMVAESGAAHVGQWQSYERNIVDDYVKAFGEQPGRLIAVGIMTDTDNTGEITESWYGDIRLLRRPTSEVQQPSQ